MVLAKMLGPGHWEKPLRYLFRVSGILVNAPTTDAVALTLVGPA
jgi:hypothetical protein